MAQQNLFQFQSQQKKPNTRPVTHDSVLESLRGVGSQITNTVKDDVVGGIAEDAFQSLLGNFPKPREGSQEDPFSYPFPKKERRPMQTHRPEILSPERIQAEHAKTAQQIEAVRQELVALAQAVGSLSLEVEKAVNDVPVNPGVYHMNFFERLKGVLKMIRQNVQDSRSWLALSSGKKKKRGFWGLYKKHGTQFGLSSERTAATQTG